MMAVRVVLVNDRGHIIGQDHHRARLTDHEVDLILLLRAAGLTYRRIAEKFEVSKSTVRDYCKARRRAQMAMGQKTLATKQTSGGAA